MAEFLSVRQAAKLVPSQVSIWRVYDWISVGVKDHRGNKVRLEVQRVGRRLYTTRGRIKKFLAATSARRKS